MPPQPECMKVRVSQTTTISSQSEMSIMARSPDHNDSVVLLEEAEGKQLPVIVAREIAKPEAD